MIANTLYNTYENKKANTTVSNPFMCISYGTRSQL